MVTISSRLLHLDLSSLVDVGTIFSHAYIVCGTLLVRIAFPSLVCCLMEDETRDEASRAEATPLAKWPKISNCSITAVTICPDMVAVDIYLMLTFILSYPYHLWGLKWACCKFFKISAHSKSQHLGWDIKTWGNQCGGIWWNNGRPKIHTNLDRRITFFVTRKFPNGQFRFQQNNDSEHTSRVAKAFPEDEGINWWHTPANSPDLNPI